MPSANPSQLTRRDWLMSSAALHLAPAPGAVPGSVLVHEHVLVDFAGAAPDSRSRYSLDDAYRAALPKLQELKAYGCVRFHECTPDFLGRDPRLLLKLQDAAGIELWTNTGIYGAAKRAGIPKFAYEESAEQLARRWISEFRNGVEGMKPRFIKTAVNVFPFEPIDTKLNTAPPTLKRAPPAISSPYPAQSVRESPTLDPRHLNCPANKIVWVHAQSEKDHTFHVRAGQAGAWVEFDGINSKSAAWHLECVRLMEKKELLGRTLISQDSGWYRVGEPGGGQFNGFTFIYTGFLPQLDPGVRKALMADNPRRAFAG